MEKNVEEKSLPRNVIIEDISHLPLVKQMQSVCPGVRHGFIKVHPFGHIFPTGMEDYLQTISEFECRDDDIWVASFPKCGTTWTQEMVWCIANNIDMITAKAIPQKERVPFFDYTGIKARGVQILTNSFEQVDRMTSPRIIKTHLPFHMLPKQCHGKKLIYVTRNPRDACVSFYHHYQIFYAYGGSFQEYARLFLGGISEYCPMLPHVLAYWKQKDQPNVLFLTFEEMKRNLSSVIMKVATFLGKVLSSEDVEGLCDHLSFTKMKTNEAVNKSEVVKAVIEEYKKQNVKNLPQGASFMRKGEIGNWKEYFDEELLKEFKDWERNGLKEEDLEFVYE